MIFLTTTAIEIDEELLNRCLVLTVDEGREQTRAIHALQRESADARRPAGATSERRAACSRCTATRSACCGRSLVVNPYAPQLTFLDDQTRTRRDHVKYLTLIRTIALLHQHQRPSEDASSTGGEPLEYIEVELDDIALANRLAHEVLGRTLDELPPQTRRLARATSTRW